MNLTQRREGRKDAIIAPLFPIFTPSFPRKRESIRLKPSPPDAIIAPLFPIFTPSFPRKRESRRLPPCSPPEIKYKYQPADPFSLYGLIGVGFEIHLSPRHSRESGNPEGAAKPASRNQVQIATSGSPLPLRERARVRVRRAPARLCGRDARAPRQPNLPL